ncbi:MAG: hypothetical protein PHF67_00835 [Candidatus Nanoarchaeia archaeon]|nr:hypothetical protein [Candidatus Nanoarchaeia archaeon]
MSNIAVGIGSNPEEFSLALQNFLVQATDSYKGDRFQAVVGPDIPRGCEGSFLLKGHFCSRKYNQVVDSAGVQVLDDQGRIYSQYERVPSGTFFWAQVLQKDSDAKKTFVASKTKYEGFQKLEWTLWTNDPYFQGALPGVEWKGIGKPTLIVPNAQPEPVKKLDTAGLNHLVEETYWRMVQGFRGKVYCWQNCSEFLTPQGKFDPSSHTPFN